MTAVQPARFSKERARALFAGVEGLILPSFGDGFRDLDEAGLRHDVRFGIAQGYFSLFCSKPGLTRAEYVRLLTIVADEAGERIATSAVVGGPAEADNLALLEDAERAGCSHVLLTVRSGAPTNDELYAAYRRLIDATPMGIVLYAYRSPAFAHLHPSGIPLDVFDRLADLPNVVAVKLTQTLDPTTALACTRRLSGRLLVGPADLSMLAILAQSGVLHWTGQWLTDSVQSPEKRNVVELVAQLSAGRIDEALESYWPLARAYEAFAALQRPYLLRAAHPWNQMKYYQWCVGGNGGLMRPGDDTDEAPDDSARAAIRQNYVDAGIPLRDTDDATFARGRARSGEQPC